MFGNMNEKGRQIKLLAAIAVIAMVFCALAVVMPSDSVDAVPTSDESHESVSDTTLSITSANVAEYAGGIYASSTDGLTITIASGVTLEINTTTSYGIYSAGALTINGPGSLIINVDFAEDAENESLQAWGIYSAGAVTIAAPTEINSNVDVSSETVTAAGHQAVGIYGTAVTFNADADVYAGNRAVYASGAVTIGNNATVNVGAYEKAIRGTTANSSLVVNGTLNAFLLSGEGDNVQGNNDRFGIKTGVLTVNATGSVTSEGVFLYGADSAVQGKLEVAYNSVAGAADEEGAMTIPMGLVMPVSTSGSDKPSSLQTIAVSGQGSIVVDDGNYIVGAIKGQGTTEGTVTFGSVASGVYSPVSVGNITFTAGSLVMNGDIESGSITYSGTNVLNGNLGEGVNATTSDNGTLTGDITSDGPVTGNYTDFAVLYWDDSAATSYYYFLDENGVCDMRLPIEDGDAVRIGNMAETGDVAVTVVTPAGSEFLLTAEGDRVTASTDSGELTTVGGTATAIGNGTTSVYTDATATIVTVAEDITIQMSSGNNDGKVAIQTMDLDYTITINTDADLILPYGETLTFGDEGDITATGDMYILGDLRTTADEYGSKINNSTGVVYALDTTAVAYYTTNDVTSTDSHLVAISTSQAPVRIDVDNNATALEALNGLLPGMSAELYSGTNKTVATLNITGPLDLEGVDISIASTLDLTINVGTGTASGQRATVTLVDVTIDRGMENASVINVATGSTLSVTDSLLYIVVNSATGASVEVNNAGVVYENTSSDVRVGYGTTLTLTGNVTSVVDVYGNLVIESTAQVPKGTTMSVYSGASLTVNGTLTILGNAVFEAGSEATVNGTVTVGNTSGGAKLTVMGDVTVKTGGVLNIAAVQATNVNVNQLVAPADTYQLQADGKMGYAHKLSVFGTLNMNGAMSGYIHDYGTVAINGSAISGATGTVVLYPGVTIANVSFAGTLNVTDQGAVDSLLTGSNMAASDGNVVTILNATNVTVSASYETINWTSADGTNNRDFQTVLSVSGAMGKVGGDAKITIDTDDSAANGVGRDNDVYAYVTVPEGAELTFGLDVSAEITGDLVVDGTVNFVIGATVNNDRDDKTFTNSGEITVNGTITATGGEIADSGINAVKYTVTVNGTEPSVTDTFTNFAAAIDNAANADQDTVYILGDVTVSADDNVDAGIIVQMQRNSTITVDEGVTLTVADGATVAGSGATITVDGTMISNDYATDISRTITVVSDVIRTEGAVRTWTSLAGALDLGWTEITLNRPVSIDSDMTIPAGTTVRTDIAPGEDGYSIEVKGATLTVEGSLQMGSNAEGALSIVPGDDGTEGEIVVPGNMQITVLDIADLDNESIAGIAGAHFQTMVGAYTVQHVGSIAYAAEATSANTAVTDDGVTVIGIVAAENVTFTAPETGDLKVTIDDDARLSMGTMALVGDVTVDVNGTFSGSVSAPCGDGTSNATVQMSGVKGINLVAGHSIGATATTYTFTATENFTGSATITAGTVTVGSAGFGTGADATLTVGSGATLSVPSGATFTAGTNQRNVPVTVEGTLSIAGAISETSTEIYVPGTMEVTRNVTIPADVEVRIAGALNVADGYELTVNGTLIFGDAPETLGETTSASASGDVEIVSGVILAYAGTDMAGAAINWNEPLSQSDAESTVYNINGTEYATMYTVADKAISTINSIDSDGLSYIELSGLEAVSAWYATQADAENGTNLVNPANIGEYDAVYALADPAYVFGEISEGTGLTIYIDGKTIDNYAYRGAEDVDGGVVYFEGYSIPVGTHTITIAADTGYTIENATITFNGDAVQNGSITLTADMNEFMIVATGAEPAQAPSGGDSGSTSDDGMGLTDYLLIILVVLIVIMAIMVAMRLMRS